MPNLSQIGNLAPNARAWKTRIFGTAVGPKIGKKGALGKYFNTGPPTIAADIGRSGRGLDVVFKGGQALMLMIKIM
jgi:hypothetical protein